MKRSWKHSHQSVPPASSLTAGLTGDALAPSWAVEEVKSDLSGEGQLSKSEKKKVRKLASRNSQMGYSEHGLTELPVSDLSATISVGRLVPSLFQGYDTADKQAASLWAAFRGSTAGSNLTQLEYTMELGGESIATVSGLHPASPPTPLVEVVKEILPGWGRLLGTKAAAEKRPNATPSLIILTHSAPRACELISY